MNVLYGVQATGNGHISRSREIIRSLKKRGHHVEVILSGRDPALLWDMEDFEPYRVYRGLTFSTKRGRVQVFKTACRLNFLEFHRDILSFEEPGWDVVITDFEPVTARVARRWKIPCIGIGHQYAFWYDIPKAGDHFLAQKIIRHYAPAAIPVGLHWHPFDCPILPPVIPESGMEGRETVPDKILVYLPFEEEEDIGSLCRLFPDYRFYIYHKEAHRVDQKNLKWRPYSRTGFLEDLASCSGVITNAGFELASEALALGKKILLKPVSGQMEQLSNALAISMLGLGAVMKRLSPDKVADFLKNGRARRVRYPNTAERIAAWVEKGRWEDLGGLARECWDITEMDRVQAF